LGDIAGSSRKPGGNSQADKGSKQASAGASVLWHIPAGVTVTLGVRIEDLTLKYLRMPPAASAPMAAV